MLRGRYLGGAIILVDAYTRHSGPITGESITTVNLGLLSGDLDRLARGCKVCVQMQIGIFGDDMLSVVFEGIYTVLPIKSFGVYEEGGNEEE